MLPFTEEELLCRLALCFIEGVGPKTTRALLSHFGDAQSVLAAPLKSLTVVPGMGEPKAKACKDAGLKERAAQELRYMGQHGIQPLFITDKEYPERLRYCDDAPMMLFYRGNASLNAKKMLAIVGTRKNTDYGTRATEHLLEGLRQQEDLIIVSGLAFGIDAIAHRKSLQLGIPTIGVVAHGQDMIYPTNHKSLAQDMMQQGGVLTEFVTGTKLHPSLFPLRNRIVAGLCDATVVVESDEKGGAMITGYLAASYNREVAAFPGRAFDAKAAGPNKLIRKQIASLITDAQDLLSLMNWTGARPNKRDQQELFKTLTEEEQRIAETLKDQEGMHADELMLRTGLSTAQIGALLLQMEMSGLVKALPGKMFRLV
ncbi:MAG: DNA-protecting protein DprA [Bacteroidetes bacterium]|nr:DNA-protecting protein DprA [Bacteroidota bacterium]MBS1630885.1 DNA-protecting protein DprA [Bacteroidota bacterium]